MTTKALEEMSGVELLAEYNRLSITKRKAKFDSKEEAIKRIRALVSEAKTAPTPAKEKKTSPPKTAREESSMGEASRKVRGGESVIRLQVQGDRNPRREGSEAHRHYEAMRGGITVSQYLDKFEKKDRRTARQWLSNTVRDGFVKILEQ